MEAEKIEKLKKEIQERLIELPRKNKYQVTIKGTSFDVYDVITAFGVTCPAKANAIKKLLKSGQRGYKDEEQDLNESIKAIVRAKELLTNFNKDN